MNEHTDFVLDFWQHFHHHNHLQGHMRLRANEHLDNLRIKSMPAAQLCFTCDLVLHATNVMQQANQIELETKTIIFSLQGI